MPDGCLTEEQIKKYGIETQEDVERWVKEFGGYFFNRTAEIIKQSTCYEKEISIPRIKIAYSRMNEEDDHKDFYGKKAEEEFNLRIKEYISENGLDENNPDDNKKIETEQFRLFKEVQKKYFLDVLEETTIEGYLRGKYNQIYDAIILNKEFFNTRALDPFSIVHEMLHVLRNRAYGTEVNKGYDDARRLYNEILNKDQEFVEAHVIEFFSELDKIVCAKVLESSKYEGLEKEGGEYPDIKGVRLAAEYFRTFPLKRFEEIERDSISITERIRELSEIQEGEKTKALEDELKELKKRFISCLEDYFTHVNLAPVVYRWDSIELYMSFYLDTLGSNFKKALGYLRGHVDKEKFLYHCENFPKEIDGVKEHMLTMKQIEDEHTTDMNYSSGLAYVLANLAIGKHKEELKNEWPEAFLMTPDEIQGRYFDDTFRKIMDVPNIIEGDIKGIYSSMLEKKLDYYAEEIAEERGISDEDLPESDEELKKDKRFQELIKDAYERTKSWFNRNEDRKNNYDFNELKKKIKEELDIELE